MPRRESAPPTEKSPEISVVIPAFNAEATLEAQLSALVDQSAGVACEILVCDNGSTDSTREIVENWSRRYAFVRLIDASARKGPGAARNIGVGSARSQKIAFCDADDVVGDAWLPTMRTSLDRHEFVAGAFDFTRLNGGADTPGLWTAQSSGLTSKPYLPHYLVAGAGNMGIRTSVFVEVGGFFEGLRTAEDDDLCLRIQLMGHALTFVPTLLLHVRRRGGLRELSKQARSYAAGEKRLHYRYVAFDVPDLGAASASGSAALVSPPDGGEGRGRARRIASLIARAVRKAASIRRPSDLSAVVWRWSWKLGWTLAREDRTIPRLSPDDLSTLIVSTSGGLIAEPPPDQRQGVDDG